MFHEGDPKRNAFMLTGKFARQGYDWWWHSFTGISEATGEERTFFIEFFVMNPALGGADPILGQLPENREAGLLPSYVCLKCGCWGEKKRQLHRFFGIDRCRIPTSAPYQIFAEDCFASDEALKGKVYVSTKDADAHPEWMCDAGEMTFDLKLDKRIAFNVGYGTSLPLREMRAFEMYWHAEGMKTAFSGTVSLDGEIFRVSPDTCYGYADKNWGCAFTSPWVWLASNDLVSRRTGRRLKDSAFDIGGGRPRVFGVPLERQLLSAFYYEGKEYEFNFSKFWTGTRTKFACGEADDEIRWHVRQWTPEHMMDTVVRCKKADMLLLNYEEPDGRKRHNHLWNGGNGTGQVRLYERLSGRWCLIDEIEAGHIGCEYGEFDR